MRFEVDQSKAAMSTLVNQSKLAVAALAIQSKAATAELANQSKAATTTLANQSKAATAALEQLSKTATAALAHESKTATSAWEKQSESFEAALANHSKAATAALAQTVEESRVMLMNQRSKEVHPHLAPPLLPPLQKEVTVVSVAAAAIVAQAEQADPGEKDENGEERTGRRRRRRRRQEQQQQLVVVKKEEEEMQEPQEPQQQLPVAALPRSAEQILQCPICLDMLTCPVTIGCGHTFCMQCINTEIESRERGDRPCPVCRVRYSLPPRPKHYIFTADDKSHVLDELLKSMLAGSVAIKKEPVAAHNGRSTRSRPSPEYLSRGKSSSGDGAREIGPTTPSDESWDLWGSSPSPQKRKRATPLGAHPTQRLLRW